MPAASPPPTVASPSTPSPGGHLDIEPKPEAADRLPEMPVERPPGPSSVAASKPTALPTKPTAVAGSGPLTAAAVQARLVTRSRRLEQCGSPLLVLELVITNGRPELSAVNGMSEGDPLHACVLDKLRGLTFPVRQASERFSVTLELGHEEK